jgi:hypothetical protein
MVAPKKSLEDMMLAELRGAAETPRSPIAATQRTGTAANIDKVTLYLPKPVYRLIKQMALDFERRPHDLLLEGIDLLLARYGKSIAAVTKKQKS